jgi:hypothetical protein
MKTDYSFICRKDQIKHNCKNCAWSNFLSLDCLVKNAIFGEPLFENVWLVDIKTELKKWRSKNPFKNGDNEIELCLPSFCIVINLHYTEVAERDYITDEYGRSQCIGASLVDSQIDVDNISILDEYGNELITDELFNKIKELV